MHFGVLDMKTKQMIENKIIELELKLKKISVCNSYEWTETHSLIEGLNWALEEK